MSENSQFSTYRLIAFIVIGFILGIGVGLTYMQSQTSQLQSQIHDLLKAKNTLKVGLNNATKQLESLKDQINSLSGQNDELKAQLEEALNQILSPHVVVSQEEGKIVYWVLPGPRRLSPSVFGTPDKPMFGEARLEWAINAAKKLPPPLNESVSKLLMDLPFLVAVPESLREESPDGGQILKVPTLFSDNARIVSGSMRVEYIDKIPYDLPGPPTNTPDEVRADITFTDPAGNTYQLNVKKVFMPPIPGYETAGGVMVGAWHHGTTGTGSPLMPKVFTYGAFWAIGDVISNGEVVESNVVIHVMTTQVVRDKDYRLVLDEELPLSIDNTPAGQTHHTHVVVFPIKVTPSGPEFHPLNLPFKLPNGMPQPFIHVMFEQEVIESGPYSNQSPSQGSTQPSGTNNNSVVITITATEWSFNPDRIVVHKGQVVTIVFVNNGTVPHNLYIDGYNVKTPTIEPGEQYQINFTADSEGEFQFWCTVPGHKEAGLQGELIVQP